MKNVIFMMNVDCKGEGRYATERTHGYQYCEKSWREWANKHGFEVLVMHDPIHDNDEMSIGWQRYYIHDILESNGIDYDQILMVDADTIVHPDCPNVFELSEHKFCGVFNDGSYDWLYRSIENYSKYIFKDIKFDWTKYINTGFMIVNKSHRKIFKTVVDLFWENNESFMKLQNHFLVGSDQTPVNFMIQMQNVDMKLLPYQFNMVDMFRKEILTGDMLFTKVGWVYHFNAIPQEVKDHYGGMEQLMKRTYEELWK